MRLGTSWRVGHSIPNAVPHPLHAAICAFETQLGRSTGSAPNADTDSAYWRLTWLEGQPRLSCTANPAMQLLLTAAGPQWLPAAATLHPEAAAVAGEADDDDDAWLS